MGGVEDGAVMRLRLAKAFIYRGKGTSYNAGFLHQLLFLSPESRTTRTFLPFETRSTVLGWYTNMALYSVSTIAGALAALVSSAVHAAVSLTSAPTSHSAISCGDNSTEWQQCNSYAGNINVNRHEYPNDTLFFWAFEKEDGSLTADNSTEPWAVWLQGGPGTSSLYGLFTENGPMHVVPNEKRLTKNKHAWNNLIDYIWVDQPVGVGYSTAERHGYVKGQDQIGTDFVGFLSNLVQVFPSLATRPFYLTGESYAGRYIPYIAKTLFSMPDPPVKLAKIMVGDPAFGSVDEFKTMPTLSLIETYPQLIAYDTEVYDYFKEQAHLCRLDLNLSYPQTGGKFPTIKLRHGQKQKFESGTLDEDPNMADDPFQAQTSQRFFSSSYNGFLSEVQGYFAKRPGSGIAPRREDREQAREAWKRNLNLSGGAKGKGTIDPWYGCFVWEEIVGYAVNFTYPWSETQEYYDFDVPDVLKPRPAIDPSFFLNNPTVREAIHAPAQNWTHSIKYPWGSKNGSSDPSPEPMVFFDELATNMTNNGVHMIIYVGNDDGISPHFGTEVTIQVRSSA
ncbi:hypothetical protein NM688_g5321 [Phlebia brevispora]|uniref:Uncharacterized protein n=1 Tax=Phlebia brevispora TaxID=194682 RepID=A0ACC1SX92_9APHY|nr:hypothetical protein NM688_g5321 [Phlebia brevispora]